MLRQVCAGQSNIWIVEDEKEDIAAVVVTAVMAFPRKRTVQIPFLAGKRLTEWWPDFVEEMDTMARAVGASAIYAYGRPGWVRFWKARGVAQHVASECLVREIGT